MKNIFRLIGISFLLFSSFYFTDKVALLVQNKNPLIKEINRLKKRYEVLPVNAIIEGSSIIPGISGKTVNVVKSFNNMKQLGEFNEHYLIYDLILPTISTNNNLNKIIINGNEKKMEVAIILNDNEIIKNYFIKNDIKGTILFTENMKIENNCLEYINNEVSKLKFNNVESLLNKNKKNKNICVLGTNLDICKKNNKYLVMPILSLGSSNIIDVKNNIKKGSIILIKNPAKLNDVKVLINQINYFDYKIVHLSNLISEI